MSRLFVVREKEGRHDEARRLLERGPPIDPGAKESDQHAVFADGDG